MTSSGRRLPDLRGRAPEDPNWVDPTAEAERRGLVYCCGTIGWVTPGEAYDHSYNDGEDMERYFGERAAERTGDDEGPPPATR